MEPFWVLYKAVRNYLFSLVFIKEVRKVEMNPKLSLRALRLYVIGVFSFSVIKQCYYYWEKELVGMRGLRYSEVIGSVVEGD